MFFVAIDRDIDCSNDDVAIDRDIDCSNDEIINDFAPIPNHGPYIKKCGTHFTFYSAAISTFFNII